MNGQDDIHDVVWQWAMSEIQYGIQVSCQWTNEMWQNTGKLPAAAPSIDDTAGILNLRWHDEEASFHVPLENEAVLAWIIAHRTSLM